MENSDVKMIVKIPVQVQCYQDEKQRIEYLESIVGTKTPDGQYEFVGYEDLVKLLT